MRVEAGECLTRDEPVIDIQGLKVHLLHPALLGAGAMTPMAFMSCLPLEPLILHYYRYEAVVQRTVRMHATSCRQSEGLPRHQLYSSKTAAYCHIVCL